MQIITINTPREKCIVDVTKLINDLLNKNFYDKGIIHINLLHTSCALTLADLDPQAESDYINALTNLFAKMSFSHPHDPTHFPDHVLSSIIGTNLNIPVQSGTMFLGQWQKVVLLEFNGPKERRLSLTYLAEPIIK